MKGRCCWEKFPGLTKSKANVKRSYERVMKFKECSAMMGVNIFLCNGRKGGKVVACHMAYHKANCNMKFPAMAGG